MGVFVMVHDQIGQIVQYISSLVHIYRNHGMADIPDLIFEDDDTQAVGIESEFS